MKQLYTMCILVLIFAMYGCGDKTTINGYSEDEVSKMLADNKDTVYQVTNGDSVLTYIYVTDTLYNEIVDTVYNRVTDTLYKEMIDTVYNKVVDTLYNELIDTIYTRVVDTVVNTLVDTIVTRVIDTVINTMVDTIYTRVIDTVFATLNDIGIDTELPRDTTIVLNAEVDGSIITKQYTGFVYKNVFYESKLYQYADTSRNSTTYYPLTTVWEMCDTYSNNLCDRYTLVNQCGGILPPSDGLYHLTYSSSVSKTYYSTYQTIPGWRMFDDADAYALKNMLDLVIQPGAKVFLSKISSESTDPYGRYFNDGFKHWQANVATSTGVTVADKPMNYMCAYDLK